MKFTYPSVLTEDFARQLVEDAPDMLQGIAFVAVANAKMGNDVHIPVESYEHGVEAGALVLALGKLTGCPAENIPKHVFIAPVDAYRVSAGLEPFVFEDDDEDTDEGEGGPIPAVGHGELAGAHKAHLYDRF